MATSLRATADSAEASVRQPLRVVVANDHHHVLPEIHLAIRRRVLPFSGVHIVHFDAHPDLSFSSAMDVDLVYRPDELYDALDESPSGIAEFLLPLVFAGHVDRVTWIKPHWATQMVAGDVMDHIAIGRSSCSDRLVVSCPSVHFIDDELYAPQCDMVPDSVKFWDLHVVELPSPPLPASLPWVLDIDLDYFSTWNPFRKDLEPFCSATEIELLTRLFTRPRFRSTTSFLPPHQRMLEREQFVTAMARVQHNQLYDQPSSPTTTAVVASLVALYDDQPAVSQELLNQFFALLRAHAPTRALLWNAAFCLDLPHHESSADDIELLLGRFRAFVASRAPLSPPALVTIATSVSDRFLPPHQLEFVKSRVLDALSETLGPVHIDEIEYEPVET